MEQPLWAPWRMEFIESPKQAGCIFCRFPSENRDRENFIVARSTHAFAILNRFPYTSGHVMVVPNVHGGDMSAVAPEVFADWMDLLRRADGAIRNAYQPQGMNIGMNLGQVAGAGVLDHLHWHLVPRWAGDNNFMPVIGDTRVVIEQLERTWERLSGAMQ